MNTDEQTGGTAGEKGRISRRGAKTQRGSAGLVPVGLRGILLLMGKGLMGRATQSKPLNRSLHAAKAAKQDEFYTQFVDIQKEVEAYLEFDPDTFRGKVVYCNCDDPLRRLHD